MAYYLEPPSDEIRQNIYAELNVTEDSLKRDVEYLMKWLEQQPHLPHVEDFEFVRNFLLQCKNNMGKTKQRLESYFVSIAIMADVFADLDPRCPKIKQCMQVVGTVGMPRLTPDGFRIFIHYNIDRSASYLPAADVLFKTYMCVWHYYFKTNASKGYVVIIDMEKMDVALSAVYFAISKKMVQFLKNGLPSRVRKLYFINTKEVFQPLIRFFLALLNKKLADKIEIGTRSRSDLCDVLPSYALPSNYGGTERSLEELSANFHEAIVKSGDWILSLQNFKADLTKIENNSEFLELSSMYGCDGSFRPISLD